MANKNELVPHDQLAPGFEAVYTGETSSTPVQETEFITTLNSDKNGNLFCQWSTVPWTLPGKEAEWNEEAKLLNEIQARLGPLNNDIRQIRSHITSLTPCDSGVPVMVDELLIAIGRGKLDLPSFCNGCWCSGMWWQQKSSQPRHRESFRTIHAVLVAYLADKTRQATLKVFPQAADFVNRSYDWLGPVSGLTNVQRKMLERMLLTIDFFTKTSGTLPDAHSLRGSDLETIESLGKDLFLDENGRGPRLDAEISDQAGLPKIHPRWDPKYRENLDKLEDPQKQGLYKTCCAIASGVHTLSDCHHNTFRYLENWIHGIGTGQLSIPTRNDQSEKQRLGHLLLGYTLGLNKWLLGIPMQFLLLDLGHIELGFDPKNEILRVYACLGEETTATKRWLAACLWYNLVHNEQGGLASHTELVEHCHTKGIDINEWMSSVPPQELQDQQ